MSLTLHSNAVRPHDGDVVSLCTAEGRVFSGGEDGKIKIWDEKLSLTGEIQAHTYLVYDITYKDGCLYTSSYDGKICIWSAPKSGESEWPLKTTLEGHSEGVRKMKFYKNTLYSGDEQGMVVEWIDGVKKREFGILEEIWDLWVIEDVLYTVRDKDVLISNIQGKNNATTKGSLVGRGPMHLMDGKLYCITRDGLSIFAYGSMEDKYPMLGTLSGHEKIINALTGKNNIIFSAGWDGKIKAWDVRSMKCVSTYDATDCINCLSVNDNMIVYGGGSNGIFVGLQFN